MRRIMKVIILFVVMTACAVAATPTKAQQAKDAPPAPLPSQIAAAKKVFIANAWPAGAFLYTGGPNRFYNQFYAALKSWGRYELVGTPAEADLVLEISSSGEQIYGSPGSSRLIGDTQLRLAIIDPGTRITVWAFVEHVEPALLQGNRDKNFDQAFNYLVNDLRNISGSPPAVSSNTNK